jgi:DoxX-like protein
MRTASLVLTVLAAAIAIFSGVAKIRRDPKVVKVIHDTVGVPMEYLPLLAACEFAGALGLVAGIWWWPLGFMAGIALAIYFVGAVVSHLRVGDFAGIGPAAFVLGIVAAALVTRFMA